MFKFWVGVCIDIALDVADNTLFGLDYFIKSLKRWNLLVKAPF